MHKPLIPAGTIVFMAISAQRPHLQPPEPWRVAPVTAGELVDRERFGWLYSPPQGKIVGFEYVQGEKFVFVMGELSVRRPPEYSEEQRRVRVYFAKYGDQVLGDMFDNESSRTAPEVMLFHSSTPVHLCRETFLGRVRAVVRERGNEQAEYFMGLVQGEIFAADQ